MSESPGKSQKDGQEDQGIVKQPGRPEGRPPRPGDRKTARKTRGMEAGQEEGGRAAACTPFKRPWESLKDLKKTLEEI